jgi:hypothetical protein
VGVYNKATIWPLDCMVLMEGVVGADDVERAAAVVVFVHVLGLGLGFRFWTLCIVM